MLLCLLYGGTDSGSLSKRPGMGSEIAILLRHWMHPAALQSLLETDSLCCCPDRSFLCLHTKLVSRNTLAKYTAQLHCPAIQPTICRMPAPLPAHVSTGGAAVQHLTWPCEL